MALSIAGIDQAFQASELLVGQEFPSLSRGLAMGIYTWATNPVALSLVGTATGFSGVGAVNPATTKIVVYPDVELVAANLSAGSLDGVLRDTLAQVIAVGVSQAFAQAQYVGTSSTVGNGADLSRVMVADPSILAALITSGMLASLGQGVMSNTVAFAMSLAISNLLLQATATGTVSGTTTIPPAPLSGPTFSSVI